MYPKANAKPFKYLFDDFDSNIPLHHYWDARQADSAYPSNIGGGGYYLKKLRSPEWANVSSNLVFPMYTLLSSPTYQRAKNLVVKVNSMVAPFTFQLAFKFSQLDNFGAETFPRLLLTSFQIFNDIGSNTSSKAWRVGLGTAGVSGQCFFADNSFAANQDIYFKFLINADLTCTWDFKVDGVTPALASSGTTWAPGDYRTATSDFNTNITTYFPEHFPLKVYPQGGGKLDYLELKIHDHTL